MGTFLAINLKKPQSRKLSTCQSKIKYTLVKNTLHKSKHCTRWSILFCLILSGSYDKNRVCTKKIEVNLYFWYPEISFGNIESQKITEISFYNRNIRYNNNNRNILCTKKIGVDLCSAHPEISFLNKKSEKITEISFYNRNNRNYNNS